jgi:hypothetical protein
MVKPASFRNPIKIISQAESYRGGSIETSDKKA